MIVARISCVTLISALAAFVRIVARVSKPFLANFDFFTKLSVVDQNFQLLSKLPFFKDFFYFDVHLLTKITILKFQF